MESQERLVHEEDEIDTLALARGRETEKSGLGLEPQRSGRSSGTQETGRSGARAQEPPLVERKPTTGRDWGRGRESTLC